MSTCHKCKAELSFLKLFGEEIPEEPSDMFSLKPISSITTFCPTDPSHNLSGEDLELILDNRHLWNVTRKQPEPSNPSKF